MGYAERVARYKTLEEDLETKIMLYATSDRRGAETQIGKDALPFFADHLDALNLPPRLHLMIYTQGGDTLAAWSLVNLLRQFCEELHVIVPQAAMSAGTLVSLGCNSIMMTKQGTLGPIDPSVNSPLNPQMPGGTPQQRMPLSVEAVAGFIDLAQQMVGAKDEESMRAVIQKLADHVHPVALGNVYRSRAQIVQLAEKLLRKHYADDDKIKKIISVLCRESGSHDYAIYRREAKELGLPVVKPTQEQYGEIKAIYKDFAAEMALGSKLDLAVMVGQGAAAVDYNLVRGIIESVAGGADHFLTEGTLSAIGQGPAGPGVMAKIKFEGWRHTHDGIN